MVYYDFTAAGIPLLRHSPTQSLSLHDSTGNSIPVTAKNIFQPRKNLGHIKGPAGTYKTQADAILAKAQSISQAIAQCPVSREAAYVLYQSVYRPAVEYTLGQSFLNAAQLGTIAKKSLPWIFNKCGYARSTSRALLYGPSDLAGGGFVPLNAKAGSDYVTHFLKFWRSPHTQCGKLLRIVYSWTQFQSGQTKAPLQDTSTNMTYINSRFITKIQTYL